MIIKCVIWGLEVLGQEIRNKPERNIQKKVCDLSSWGQTKPTVGLLIKASVFVPARHIQEPLSLL